MIVEEVKITRNYQITLPASIREELDVKVGDKVILVFDGKKVILIPKNVDIIEIVQRKRFKLGKKIKVEEIEEIINEIVEEITSGGR